MKRIVLIAIAVVSMACASYAANANLVPWQSNEAPQSLEQGKLHSKEYLDYKKMLDAYENDLKAAKSCEDISSAQLALYINLLSLIEDDYEESEKMSAEEEQLLANQADRIDKMLISLETKWNCEAEEEQPQGNDYERVMSALTEFETAINNAATCEDLNEATNDFLKQTEDISGVDFTDEEAKAFQEKSDKVGQKLSQKADRLCL